MEKIKFFALDRENGDVVKMSLLTETEEVVLHEHQLDLTSREPWTFKTLRFGSMSNTSKVKAILGLIKASKDTELESSRHLLIALFYALRELRGDECSYEHIEFEIKS